jgi:uridine kinase
MDTKITVTIGDNTETYEYGTSFGQIAAAHQEEYDAPIALVLENGKMRELHKTLTKDCQLGFITLREDSGHKTYTRTAAMLLLAAVDRVLGREAAENAKIAFTIGHAYYCHFTDGRQPSDGEIKRIGETMTDFVVRDVPLVKTPYAMDEAMALFRERGMSEKVKLFKFRRGAMVNVYCLDGYYDYYYGFMLPSAGYIKHFNIIRYENGLMLVLPKRGEPGILPPFAPREKLFKTLLASEEWGKKMGVCTVGDLNEAACAGTVNDMILVQEALHEHRIGEIAREIAQRGGVKFVMIAGPSSSGKTTFSHRLSIQLRTYGLTPHPIGLDDYYKNREDTPRDEKGDYDYECLEALDIPQFNRDMAELLAGKEVELPRFDFISGQRKSKGHPKQLGPEDILVIEGIHGLNPETSKALPEESKYKIYISCLTGLNVDSHNRIPTTDSRLLRRMVRDNRTRGAGAKRTIQMWPSVRRGEERYIFPFQECADVIFNSAMIYELAVLKQYAEPLLFQIGKDEPEYYEAKRLLKFLEYFLGVSSEGVPHNSICREFIGGSIFHA